MFQLSPCVYRDNFYKELRAFMKDLIKVFPDDREIKLISSSLNIAIMDDPDDKVITAFYDAINPCKNYIHSKNEELFYNKIIKSDIALFSQLGEYWSKLDASNKDIVWAYLKVLHSLCEIFFVQNN
jgi:hypothetical protein